MGIQGTEVAKESSDIIILDDNFTSVVKVRPFLSMLALLFSSFLLHSSRQVMIAANLTQVILILCEIMVRYLPVLLQSQYICFCLRKSIDALIIKLQQ